MKKMLKALAVMLAVCLLFAAFPVSASAADDGKNVAYIGSDGKQYAQDLCKVVTDSYRTLSGWNVVYGVVETDYLAVTSGTAHLILADNCVLRTNHIDVPQNATLNIYAQSTVENTMGKLYAQVDKTMGGQNAGIGGGTLPNESNINAGSIVINGGKITASGSSGAGIGGANSAAAGSVTINGGIISATGSYGAAGIGSSSSSASNTHHDGVVTINGGTVTAIGGGSAAGIGGGYRCSGKVTINSGNITAEGGYSGAAIGGGIYAGSDVVINGGTVKATGGEYDSYGTGSYYAGGGAGIGSGGSSKSSCKVTINGGDITAKGGRNAAGVGGGGFSSAFVTITGGKVIAEGNSSDCADIGNGYSRNKDEASSVIIRGGKIIARRRVGGANYDDTTPITIGWTNAYDSFYASEFNGIVTLDGTPMIYRATRETVTLPLQSALTIIPALLVTYDPGAGTGHMDTEITNPQLNYILPNNYFNAPEGTFFNGWQIDGRLYQPGDCYDLTSDITVTASWKTPASVSEIILTPDCDINDVYAGDEFDIRAEVLPVEADDKSLTWTSTDDSVAKVNENGHVWLRAVGEATVTATANDGSGAFASIKVNAKQGESVPYLDASGVQKSTHLAVPLADAAEWNDNSGGWYVATGEFTIDARVYVSGNVSLILANGCDLTMVRGICVPDGASLTIYAQSKDPDVMGALSAGDGSQKKIGAAAIGADANSFGVITINGGRITARGFYNGPGIGGGSYGNNPTGTLTINGGIINANGGFQAAGIGTGYMTFSCNIVININGGKITAGTEKGVCGIGAGTDSGYPTVNLNWTDPENDRIFAASYAVIPSLKNRFVYEDTGEAVSGKPADSRAIVPDPNVTVTVNCGDLCEPLTVNAKYGDNFFTAMDHAGVFTALDEMENDDVIFRELATRPLSDFGDVEELTDDAFALLGSTITGDMTVYACFYQKIKNVTLFVNSPVAGQTVTVDGDVQTPAPEAFLEEESPCMVSDTSYWMTQNYEILSGAFTAGETYFTDVLLTPDFGYWMDDNTVVTADGGTVVESSGRMAISVMLSVTIPKEEDHPIETRPLLGDADNDGSVTILDATCIQRVLVGYQVDSYDEAAADADCDESITILDATAIQRYLVGYHDGHPIGEPIA